MIRELTSTKYDSQGFTDQTSLARLMLSKPDQTSRGLTYLWGSGNNLFPLTFMTEGQGASGVEEVNDVQYTWDVQSKLKHTDRILNFNATTFPNPGLNGTPFIVTFETNWLIEQWYLVAPDGQTKARIMSTPTPSTSGGYDYVLELITTDPTDVCATSNLVVGSSWVMMAPVVAESYSRGNRSNVMGTGKMTNQISFLRYTKEIGGNLANKVVPIKFPTKGGGSTNLWINEEMRQFEIMMRQSNEEHFWTSEYNRKSDGTIMMTDRDNGREIPMGAGIEEMVKSTNYDTYGYNLTLRKLKTTINDLFEADPDDGIMNIVVYGGLGFLEDFDEAIKEDVNSKLFTDTLGDKTITGSPNSLSYGAYFKQYKHITGHIVTVKHVKLFDHGKLAENDRENGRLHPRTGRPMSSHKGIFLDHSMYGGQRNVKMYVQKGRSEVSGIIKGLAPVPASWGAVGSSNSGMLAHDIDATSYEKMYSKGVNIANTKWCFMLQSVV